MFDNLGFVKEGGEIVAHRTRLKISLNPILRRLLGWQIASIINSDTGEFIRYQVISAGE